MSDVESEGRVIVRYRPARGEARQRILLVAVDHCCPVDIDKRLIHAVGIPDRVSFLDRIEGSSLATEQIIDGQGTVMEDPERSATSGTGTARTAVTGRPR